jgi:hypothetical protein
MTGHNRNSEDVFIKESSKENMIGHMATVLIVSTQNLLGVLCSSSINKGQILAFNNAILLRYIWRGKLMLEYQKSKKVSK